MKNKFVEVMLGIELWDYEYIDLDEHFQYQYYNVEFKFDSLKEYNGKDPFFDFSTGKLEIYTDDGMNVEKTINIFDVPEFRKALLNKINNVIY